METKDSNLKRTLVKVVAALQIVIGALLIVGTICLTLTGDRTVRDESKRFAANLSASADALDSSRMSYEQSAANLYGLTGTMDDIAKKLHDVSESILATGAQFVNYGEGKFFPFKEWFKNSGEKLKEVGDDVVAVSDALKGQSKIINDYREEGYTKSLEAMSKISESLRRTAQALDSDNSSRWCGFVCLLGFCVSMLFFSNGVLLLVVNRLGCWDT